MSERINPHGQPVGPPVADWQGARWPASDLLEGRWCRVEALEIERHQADLYGAFAATNGDTSWTYLSYGPFASHEAFATWLRAAHAVPTTCFYAIIDAISGRAVGLASYLRVAPQAGSVEVGHVHFSDALKGTPAATEAMYLMMREAFQLGFRRYEWKCDALNAPSRRAAARLGFRFEGVFRQALVYKGRNRDTAWLSIVDGEWPAIRSALERWLDATNFDADGQQRVRLSDLTRALSA